MSSGDAEYSFKNSPTGTGFYSATFTNPGANTALQIVQQGNASASTSAGGSINVDNSLSTGAGLVVFSSQAAPAGRLIVGRASSATFNQTVAYFENAGTGHALHAANTYSGTNATGSALNVTSTNPGASAVQIGGVETGRGTIKVTHTSAGGDANASAISIDLLGSGTASQGIHIDSTVVGGTTGALLDIRNEGNQLLKVLSDAATRAVPTVVLGNGGPNITIGAGTPESVVTAPVGSMYLNTTGTVANTTVYVKRTGTGNTGWFPVTA